MQANRAYIIYYTAFRVDCTRYFNAMQSVVKESYVIKAEKG